jgi:hypothetical protein
MMMTENVQMKLGADMEETEAAEVVVEPAEAEEMAVTLTYTLPEMLTSSKVKCTSILMEVMKVAEAVVEMEAMADATD